MYEMDFSLVDTKAHPKILRVEHRITGLYPALFYFIVTIS